MKRRSQQGVALVITLILLSVITFMAVTFLVVSRKEAAAVNTLGQQSNAKFASEVGLEEAKAQIVAQMLATGNGLNFGLLVSTNFIQNSNSFITANGSLTNVTYAGLKSLNDLGELMTNLLILPRAPVFVITNRGAPNNKDFRFYLDLNRNGRYDTNGLVPEFASNGAPILDINGHQIYTFQIGDPEWIGILEHPDQRHSSSNKFIGRYCFIALPIGNSLDLNFIHNQSLQKGGNIMMPESDAGYMRNQGFGSWEINLAGFLNGLNTNSWPTANYKYNVPAFVNSGEAFNDAATVVQYRYRNNLLNLSKFTDVISNNYSAQFGNDFIDGFATGPLQTNTFALTNEHDFNLITAQQTWSGGNNFQPFFTTQDLFVPGVTVGTASFSNHLRAPGLFRDNYDRYTYYRMLAQLSFGSAPESSMTYNTNTVLPSVVGIPSAQAFTGYYPYVNRLNLNYQNVGGLSATNFQAWDALTFFTNAANRLLANAGYTFTVTNIPLYPVNEYTPALHRLLQVAANIYDASTNRSTTNNGAQTNLFYPSVFRPVFDIAKIGNITNIFISGYVEEVPSPTFTVNSYVGSYSSRPLSLPEQANQFVRTLNSGITTSNLYGVPWVIGAKKGLPNFNEFSMASVSQITRKIAVTNMNVGSTPPIFRTNVQYTIGVSNVLGVEGWNSYTNNFGRSVDLIGSVVTLVSLSNFDGTILTQITNTGSTNGWQYTLNPNQWQGAVTSLHNPTPRSLQVPLLTNLITVPDSVYHLFPFPHLSRGTNFDIPANVFQPHFILNCTNYVRYIVQDHETGRILDYVTLNQMNFARDLTAELSGPGAPASSGGTVNDGGVWLTNLQNGIPAGLRNQVSISEGFLPQGFTTAQWIADSVEGGSHLNEQQGFQDFLNGQGGLTNAMQAPYTPTRKVAVTYYWQANDPLVHYTLGDLTPNPIQNNIYTNYVSLAVAVSSTNTYVDNIGLINTRYRPWNDAGTPSGSKFDPDTTTIANTAFKDSQITGPDAWHFPTNKFPNVGWLGRVHRGTPWQTIYLKSKIPPFANWQGWSGNMITNQFATGIYAANFPDAVLTMPTNDWSILDLFTTAPNDNASRGQLSVNQTNFAAWSAILDGVIVVANSSTGQLPIVIDPRTNNAAIFQIETNIYSMRTNFPGQVFSSVGQILATPSLTDASPYLNTTGSSALASYPTDDELERIPQQIMSLLRVGSPRYVIFAYGQSLKPADHSIVQSQPFFGICTNYVITGELATRTVLRIDNAPVPGRPLTSPQAVVESFNVIPPE